VSDDRDIRCAFATLRDVDRRATPSFASITGGGRRPVRGRTPWLPATGAVALLAAAFLVLRPAPDPPSLDDAIAMAARVSAWTAPTDGFLEIDLPGSALRGDVAPFELTAIALPEMSADDARNPD
jgi:hypothetical protein